MSGTKPTDLSGVGETGNQEIHLYFVKGTYMYSGAMHWQLACIRLALSLSIYSYLINFSVFGVL